MMMCVCNQIVSSLVFSWKTWQFRIHLIYMTATHVKMEEPVENQTLVTSSAFADPAFRAMYVKLR